jgi:uncharacterized protein (TIGR03067 family)
MRRTVTAVLSLALVGLASGADDPKTAAAKLEGTYEVQDIRIGGKPDPKRDTIKAAVIKDGTLTMKGPKDDPAKFVLNPAKSPPHIDITAEGDLKILGVYEAKETTAGLELTIAMRMGPKAERPTDLKGEGKDEVLLKLFRKKAK